MNTETINKLCCPFDRADLTLTPIRTTETGAIDEGYLLCGQCNRIYPIVRGIPIMSPDEYREFGLEKPLLARWKKHLNGKTIEQFRLVDGISGKFG
ncbi:Trm112 family protein [Parapedobacter sp. 2B3]|uniref:Trm112 family protein n=1 Tax=Parapedobacter sp. 2B3 TaxID=3342381 RepID=UPI0035B5C30B